MTAYSKLPLSADEMLADARRVTGIEIADEGAREPLTILVDSYNKEAAFSEEGAKGKHLYLMRFLMNRLRQQRDFAAHPEIHDIELLPPVIINAMARTGSTKMQKVLSATGDFNWFPMWMAMNPASWTGSPGEDVTPRIADSQAFVDWFGKRSPMANSAHAMDALKPEEESYVMMHSLVSRTMAGYANAPSYSEWCMTQDQAIQFQYVVDTLKYLVWQGLADASKPFVLKSAMSIGLEEGLIRAHASPKLIMTHRNPRQFLASTCKLAEVFRLPFSDKKVEYGAVTEGIGMLGDLHVSFRDAHPEVAVLDIDYRQLRDDAASVVAAVFDYAGMDLGPNSLQNVRNWEQNNPKNRHGAFKYSLDDFGITVDEIDTAFAGLNALAKSNGIDYA